MATSCHLSVSQDCQRSTQQSTRIGKTLSKTMISGLVASCSVLVLGRMMCTYQLQSFKYTTLSAAILLFPLLHTLQGLHESWMI